MIKRIKTLKNFGIFKDFVWSGNLQDFKEKNIIYGWNYSGKTTLSRLFNSLKEKSIPTKYKDVEFNIVIGEDKKELKQTEIANNDLNIQIFNSEYIKANLKWDSDESIDAIAFDVGENVKIRDEIKTNSERVELIRGTKDIVGKITIFRPAINAFADFENSKFKIEAGRIKNDIFNSLIEFDKGHFKKIIVQVQPDLNSYLITDEEELQAIKQTAIAGNNKIKIADIVFTSEFDTLKETVETLLTSEPTEEEVIKRLQEDTKLYAWAKEGLVLHDHKENQTCAFCDNLISDNRYKQLKAFFSNADAILRNDIAECRKKINAEIDNVNKINIPNSKNDFADKYHGQFQSQSDIFQNVKKDYTEILNKLLAELDRKENGNIFIRLEIGPITNVGLESLNTWIEGTQNIVNAHNDFVENFPREQALAREKLKKHLVAKFLTEEDYFHKERVKNYAESCIRRYMCLVDKLEAKNLELEGTLKSVIAGQLELNRYIKIFLNREDIKIEVVNEDKFILKRGVDIAHNLSEGEKTAIAFAYFLVSLESLQKEGKLQNQIIFIDDPISSLDANHIAQIYSLINSFFFRKGLVADNADAVTNCFKQLFISTHNFEFFSFLKDSGQLNKRKNGPTCEYYLVKRIANDKSEIQPMPNSIKLYKSEYIYLFDIIFNFHKNGCSETDEKFILMPNALRRFLEMYTLMKLPHTRDEFDNRVSELVGEGNQLKFLNHFSHFTTFEKLTKHDELIMNLPSACQELIDLLGKDEGHFNSLKRAINIQN
jgi:wobble nucleotide-excising tRNase